jgi:hypothetical protein
LIWGLGFFAVDFYDKNKQTLMAVSPNTNKEGKTGAGGPPRPETAPTLPDGGA